MKEPNLFELNKEAQQLEIQKRYDETQREIALFAQNIEGKRSWVLIGRDIMRITGSGGVYIYDLICRLIKKIPTPIKKEYSKGLIGIHIYRNDKSGFAFRFSKYETNVIFRHIIKFAKKTHKKHIKRGQHNDEATK